MLRSKEILVCNLGLEHGKNVKSSQLYLFFNLQNEVLHDKSKFKVLDLPLSGEEGLKPPTMTKSTLD